MIIIILNTTINTIYTYMCNGMADEKETSLLDSLKELEKEFREGYKLALSLL